MPATPSRILLKLQRPRYNESNLCQLKDLKEDRPQKNALPSIRLSRLGKMLSVPLKRPRRESHAPKGQFWILNTNCR